MEVIILLPFLLELTGGSYKATGLATEPKIVVYNDTLLTLNDGATNTVGSNEWDWDVDAGNNSLWVNVGEDPDIGTLLAGKQNFIVLNTSGDYFTFENLEFRLANTTIGGIAFINGRTGTTFTNCTFQYSLKYNLYLYQTIGALVSDCTLTHNGSPNHNLYINDDDSGTTIISGNTIRYGQYGIRVNNSGNTVTIQNNTVYDTTNHAIYFSANDCVSCVVTGNIIHDYSTAFGIYIDEGNNNLTISGNTIYNGNMGIYIKSNSCAINGNTIYNMASVGVQLVNADGNSVYSNTIYDAWNDHYYGDSGGGTGIGITGSSENNNIYKNLVYENYTGISNSTASGNDGNKIYYNIVRDSVVNNISIGCDGGVNHTEIYNNTILHNPSSDNDAPYSGHGLVAQTNATKSKFANNLVIVEPDYPSAPSNSQGICISNTGVNIVEALTDHNHVYLVDTTYGYSWKYNGTQIRTLSDWQTSIQADAKIKNLDDISNLAGANSQEGNSLIADLDNNNFILQSTSFAIDAGTDVSLTTDYAGNSIYGVPDMGAYEYQPPYTIGTDEVPTTGDIRIYSDGKYRQRTASTTSATADFTVTPQGGDYQATTTQYMDITIDSWLTSGTYNKQWTATSTAGDFLTQATTTVYTIGDLAANTYYQFKVDGVAFSTAITGSACNSNGSCLSDANGQIVFTYSGGYSTHIFALGTDTTSPTAFTLSSPSNNSSISNIKPTLSWNASSDSESGLSHYQLYIDGSLDTNNISGTSATVANALSCGSHTWYIKAVDNAGNITNSNTFNLTITCGGGIPIWLLNQMNQNQSQIDDDITEDNQITEESNNSNETFIEQIKQKVFAYSQSRLRSLFQEQNSAKELKQKLEEFYGIGKIPVHRKHWHTIVNSYIYGNYPVKAITQAIKYGSKTVHPEIPFSAWQRAMDYLDYINE